MSDPKSSATSRAAFLSIRTCWASALSIIRLPGIDPDEAERRAGAGGHVVLAPAKDWPPHGWRDCLIEDPDGYTFSVGVPLPT